MDPAPTCRTCGKPARVIPAGEEFDAPDDDRDRHRAVLHQSDGDRPTGVTVCPNCNTVRWEALNVR